MNRHADNHVQSRPDFFFEVSDNWIVTSFSINHRNPKILKSKFSYSRKVVFYLANKLLPKPYKIKPTHKNYFTNHNFYELFKGFNSEDDDNENVFGLLTQFDNCAMLTSSNLSFIYKIGCYDNFTKIIFIKRSVLNRA